MYLCDCTGMSASTHCVKVVEEANAGWVRRFQRELEEGLHIQWRWDDRRAPEEGRDGPRTVNTSCGKCAKNAIRKT